MSEALVFGCNMDWDLAWGLLPEEDYLQEIVEHYDLKRHLIIPGGMYEGRRIAGVLCFVRLHKDVLEVTADSVKKHLEKARPLSSTVEPTGPEGGETSLSKKEVEALVGSYDIEPIMRAAKRDKRITRYLQRLLYSGDDLFRKKAADALGRTCAVIGQQDPGAVSKLLQGLFYAITDTAAFSWGAFEAIGEIISKRPDLFGGYAAQLYQFLGDRTRKAQTLEALGKIAKSSPEILRKHTLYFFSFLEDPDPEVRGYTAWLMGNLLAHEARGDLEKLRDDPHKIRIYEDGRLETRAVGQVAADALKRVNG